MALDRQSIEKRDFPVGRRGYDPDAVDAHLSRVADEVAELRRAQRTRGDTLAGSASEQVRAIVQAAETSAADIRAEADADAREIRDEANAEARHARAQATEQARAFVGGVAESAESMQARLNAMQTELDALTGALRAGAGRLSAELQSLHGDLADARGVVTPGPESAALEEGSASDPAAPDAGVPIPGADRANGLGGPAGASEPTDADPALPAGQPGETVLAPGEQTPLAAGAPLTDELDDPTGGAGAPGDPAGSPPAADGDLEGVRLIALNMALDGTPREDVGRYLRENFALGDADALLDEVFASVEG